MTDYPYVSGDLLEKRNTYFYTPYAGADFLRAWRLQREAAALSPMVGAAAGEALGSTDRLLETIAEALQVPVVPPSLADALARLIQRFEVSLKAFILRDDGLALFVRESDTGYWELPGGRIDWSRGARRSLVTWARGRVAASWSGATRACTRARWRSWNTWWRRRPRRSPTG